MMLFIARHRMFLTKSALEELDEGQGLEDVGDYRMEFVSEIIYSGDKVTPVHFGMQRDQEVNDSKLFQSEQARGSKVYRTAKRVSGQLLTLIVFEVGLAPLAGLLRDVGRDSTYSASYADLTLRGDSSTLGDSLAGGSLTELGSGLGGSLIEDSLVDEEGGVGQGEGKREIDGIEDAKDVVSLKDQGLYGTADSDDDDEKSLQTTYLQMDVPPVPTYQIPLFRIVAYDPKSRRKLIVMIPPEALLELAGGVHSQYLMQERRKELAAILCDSLLCYFPRGLPYEIIIPWSGADPHLMAAAASAGTKTGGVKLTMKDRTGRIFRAALRISQVCHLFIIIDTLLYSFLSGCLYGNWFL